MRAREKLNTVYFGIAAFSAGCLGIFANSIIVFVISLGDHFWRVDARLA